MRPVLAAKPAGSYYSLAGAQDKLAVTAGAVLACDACNWSVSAWLNNQDLAADATIISGHFVTDPPPLNGRACVH